MSKTLGDMEVSRSGPNLRERAERLEECVARWQIPLESGGVVAPDTSQQPQYSVKGAIAADAVGFGREWEQTIESGEGYQKPLGNTWERASTRRWVRTYRKRSR